MTVIIRGPRDPIIAPARRTATDAPLTAQQAENARRYAAYIARRQGVEAPRLRLWRAS